MNNKPAFCYQLLKVHFAIITVLSSFNSWDRQRERRSYLRWTVSRASLRGGREKLYYAFRIN
ncbi:hypothetical protein PUN28_010757 [Cardiocondyla obscurior]|uniref:Uncharacterized protein n=1 Tax=Cardiocondyla obscurior TaxID=286306 RepID=A0AAW2FM30_9HYME